MDEIGYDKPDVKAALINSSFTVSKTLIQLHEDLFEYNKGHRLDDPKDYELSSILKYALYKIWRSIRYELNLIDIPEREREKIYDAMTDHTYSIIGNMVEKISDETPIMSPTQAANRPNRVEIENGPEASLFKMRSIRSSTDPYDIEILTSVYG